VDVKQQLMDQAMRLMRDPRVMKALQNPKVMQGLMSAFQFKAKVQQNLDTNIQRLAKGLNLATAAEVRELRRTVGRLERELDGHKAPTKRADATPGR
jgi:polyhydroxyalkanoate synthesis regulator phasin